MRQLGFLAAPGIVALSEMVERLAEDHGRARLLAEAIAETPGLAIDLDEVQSNLVYFRPETTPPKELVVRLRNEDVLCFDEGERIRMVTHKDIDDGDIDRAVAALKKVS